VRGYFLDLRAKTEAACARRPERLLPADLAQLALGWWERALAGGCGDEEFLRLCRLLESKAEPRPGELRWPYPVAVAKYGLEPPWYSALAQGQIASVFLRAYLRTGLDRYAHAAELAISPLLLGSGSELVSATAAGPILEEAPSRPGSHILNGWIYAIWGLWDVHIGLGLSRAEETLSATLECLQVLLPRYDLGWWTRYSLFPGSVADVAQPFYHRLHVDQMEVLHRLTGADVFRRAARRWRSYGTLPGHLRALAWKGVFAAAQTIGR
jgi:heparosan-N-sulfate-glucuronate 5-epimerase